MKQYAGLVEASEQGITRFLVRTRTWPFRWMAQLNTMAIEYGETSRGLTCTTRVVPSWRANELELQYREWLEAKANPPKFTDQLAAHWRDKRRAQEDSAYQASLL